MKSPRTFICLCTFLLQIGLIPATDVVYAQVSFTGTELLGRPTDTSVTINVVANAALQAYFEYDTTPGGYANSTNTINSSANEPIEVVIDGLAADTRYYYRMVYSENGGSTWVDRDEYSFHTQRPPGNPFTFTVTSDSHVGILLGSDPTWQQTLSNVAIDHPDFHLDLGDTFAVDNVSSSQGAHDAYLFHRSTNRMGRISHSAPIFLALGNHEQEEGWHLFDNSNPANTLPIWCTNARKRYFLNPVPDVFYSGNTDIYDALDGDQLHEDYYAWTWGNALFVVLDPFWYTTSKPFIGNTGGGEPGTSDGDRWHWTLGQTQYNWLIQALENSNAAYKFIFMHHMTGGTDDYIRKGAYAVPYCEWGGYNENGTTLGFTTRRTGWYAPVHQVLVENGVSAVFHGHDHQYAYEIRDGIVYQSLPSAGFSGNGFNLYSESDQLTIRVLPSPGHLRVTVSPSQATVDYVQTSGGGVAYSYTIEPNEPSINNCPCDFNSDGNVNEGDLSVVAEDFGRTDCSEEDECEGDIEPLTGDNDYDGLDLSIFVDAFGRVCPE